MWKLHKNQVLVSTLIYLHIVLAFMLQQSCNFNRDHIANKTENTYYLTYVVNHDYINFNQIVTPLIPTGNTKQTIKDISFR